MLHYTVISNNLSIQDLVLSMFREYPYTSGSCITRLELEGTEFEAALHTGLIGINNKLGENPPSEEDAKNLVGNIDMLNRQFFSSIYSEYITSSNQEKEKQEKTNEIAAMANLLTNFDI